MNITLLAAFPSPSQGVWHLGPVPIRAYAIFIIVGIIAALVIGDRRWEARGGERGVIYDIALWAVPFGLIGGRLYHVITDWQTYFGEGGAGPAAALRIWDGGLGIWGAVALGGVGAWIGCRSRGIPLPAFGDAIAPGIVLAQAIGRLGNYFNQELYGRQTDVPWGMEIFYRRDPSGIIDVHSLNGVSTGQVAAVVHPTFLYELLWNLLVFAALLYVDRRFKLGHGRLFALYVAGYCVGRFGVELMRDDFATLIAGIRINSFTATFVFIGAVVYVILAPKGREAPESLRGDTAEAVPDEERSPELVKTVAAAAVPTGVVAAATVAGREEPDPEPGVESLQADEATDAEDVPVSVEDEVELEAEVTADPVVVIETPVAESVDAERIDGDELEILQVDEATVAEDVPVLVEDEAELEGEVTADPVVVIETPSAESADAQLIDEDHDPIDEDDLESLQADEATVAEGVPVSEQQEELDRDEPESAADVQAEDEEEAAEGEAIESVEDEAELEAEVTADPAVVIETPSAESADAQLIDEDELESLQADEATVAEGVPVSEQQEELDRDEPESAADVQAEDEEEAAEGEAIESVEDEAELEAEVTADPAVVIETPSAESADAQLIDEDHDPIDEADLESLQADEATVAEGVPVSEQQEELDRDEPESAADVQAEDEEEAAEGEAEIDEDKSAEPQDDQTVVSEARTQAPPVRPVPASPRTLPAPVKQLGSRIGRAIRRRRG
ncbi:prolipoprotein diacylglyceryl transferase [Mycolicibacterium mengxianglii]|uniref:prolipoprotein diacylglyceryl transferase n=1 Tax=Mycolicibacterium mengxianglii TaxID=2736649 RepID=UPI0018EEEBE0|nr:prolipoprotein diacylglyceryl transferase [Mycolicibacterium mengxianglii]